MSDGIVRIIRTDIAYVTVHEIEEAYQSILLRLEPFRIELRMQKLARGGTQWPFAWLYDVRQAPSARNDVSFEAAQAKYTNILFEESTLLCTLCETHAGVMQISRMAKLHPNAKWFVTADEDFAKEELTRLLKE